MTLMAYLSTDSSHSKRNEDRHLISQELWEDMKT